MTDLPLSKAEKPELFADAEEAGAPSREPVDGTGTSAGTQIPPSDAKIEPLEEEKSPLFPSQQCTALGSEWQAIQASFVDSPRASVEKADALVEKTIDALAASFAEMRNSLDHAWEKDREVSTEDLRVALQNYRSFFHRLLSI